MKNRLKTARSQRSRATSRRWLLPTLFAASILTVGAARAQVSTWDGGGADGAWQGSPANWTGDVAPSPGNALIFAGTVNLSTTNDYAANTQFNGITFAGGAGAFTLAGNTINLGGDIVNASASAQTISLGLNLLQNTAVNATTAMTISGVISGTGFGLTKTGAGTLTLNNANTYTGTTTVSRAALTLSFNGGPNTTDNILSAGSSLALGGGTTTGFAAALNVNGRNAAASTNTQTFASTRFLAGPSTVTTTRGNAGNTVTLNLGALTHDAGALAFFAATTGTTINTSSGNTGSQGILGAWARVGADYATVSGGSIVAYTGYATDAASITDNAAANYRFTAASTGTNYTLGAGVTNASTIQVTDTTATTSSRTITIGDGNTLRLGASGGVWRNVGTSATLSTITLTGGSLTAGGAANTPGEIVFTADGATGSGGNTLSGSLNTGISVASAITDNGTPGAVSITKNGAQTLLLTGANTYTGGTFVQEGRLRSSVAGNLGTGDVYVTDALTTAGQAYLAGAGTYANNFFIKGVGFSTGSGTSNNAAGTEGAIILNNGVTLSGRITLLGDAGLSGFNNSTQNTLSGQITGNGALTFGGTGAYPQGSILLSNTSTTNPNDWTGNTTLLNRNGTNVSLVVTTGASEQIPNGVGKGDLLLSASSNAIVATVTLNIGGNTETINGLNSADTGTVLSTNKVITGSAGSKLIVGDANANGAFTGTISGAIALTKIGTGTQTFGSGLNFATTPAQTSNTYTGGTTISGGKLSLVNTGGSATGTGAVALSGGNTTTIAGTGTSTGLLTATNGSRIAPGVNTGGTNQNFGVAGTLSLGTSATVGGLTLTNSSLDFDLAATAAGTSDKVVTAGALTLGTVSFTFNELTPGSLDTATAYTLITGDGSVVGSLTAVSGIVLQGDFTPTFSINGANELQVTFAAVAVPEPGTWMGGLLALGFAVFCACRRNRRAVA